MKVLEKETISMKEENEHNQPSKYHIFKTTRVYHIMNEILPRNDFFREKDQRLQ